jgi:AcrR family transcriptional regulator
MSTAPGLRERKKQRTRQHLAGTARALFAERGFERVTVAEIAEVAEVSEATVFNYFPRKEDLVYGRMQEFEEELLRGIRERPSGESVLNAFGRFVLEPRGFLAAKDEEAAKALLDVSRMIAASPALLAREREIFAQYTDSLAALIAGETGAAPGDLRPWVAANALIGVHRTLIDHIRRRVLDGDVNMSRLARDMRRRATAALALLEDGLGEYGRKR